MKVQLQRIFLFFFILIIPTSFATQENSKKISTIAYEILEDTQVGAKIGGMVGAVPAAASGVVPGAAIGLLVATPLAMASSVVGPFVTFFTGNFLFAPFMFFVAPVYTLGMGAMGGGYCGGVVSGTSGLVVGSGIGALAGLTKGTAFHLTEIPPAIHDQIFGNPIKRRITRHEEKLQKSMLTIVEKREFGQDEIITCSICHSDIDKQEKLYVFRHCKCDNKAVCEECQEAFLRHHLTGYDFPTDCPGGCGYPVTEVDLERLCSNEEEVKRFKKNILKSLVCKQSKLRFCPTEDCLNGKLAQRPEEAHWSCEVCHFKGCILCGEKNTPKNHICDLNSTEVKNVLAKGRMKRDPADQSKGTIRPCYYCGKLINRIDGCNSVRCTECKKTFHWNNGKKVSHDHDNEEMAYKPLNPPHF